jgi:hypothetical protein
MFIITLNNETIELKSFQNVFLKLFVEYAIDICYIIF